MPQKVYVDVELLMPKQLEKDILKNQRICPTCKGLGIVVHDNEYGLQGEPWLRGFPYKRQSLWPCPDCYNGVQTVCRFCGSPAALRGVINVEMSCKCEQAAAYRDVFIAREMEDLWQNAKKISLAEAIERNSFVFVSGPDEFIPPKDLIEYLENLKEENPNQPKYYVWGTEFDSLQLSADSLIEDACEGLHEEARSLISSAEIDRLQKFLDDWSAKNSSGTETYWPDNSIGILVE